MKMPADIYYNIESCGRGKDKKRITVSLTGGLVQEVFEWSGKRLSAMTVTRNEGRVPEAVPSTLYADI